MSVMIIVTLQAKPSHEASLASVLNEVAAPTRKQPGCISFVTVRAEGDSARLTVLQHWDSRSSHDRNTKEPHVQHFMAAVGDLLAEPPGMQWNEVLEPTA